MIHDPSALDKSNKVVSTPKTKASTIHEFLPVDKAKNIHAQILYDLYISFLMA